MNDTTNIKYRVIDVDEKESRFVVRYYTDILTEEFLSGFKDDDGNPKCGPDGKPISCRTDVSLTLYNPDATHEEIEQQIMMNAPAEWMKVIERGLQNEGKTTGMQHLVNKVHKDHEFVYVPPTPPVMPDPATANTATTQTLSDEEVQSLLSKLNGNI
jgi:hypothetical protein